MHHVQLYLPSHDLLSLTGTASSKQCRTPTLGVTWSCHYHIRFISSSGPFLPRTTREFLVIIAPFGYAQYRRLQWPGSAIWILALWLCECPYTRYHCSHSGSSSSAARAKEPRLLKIPVQIPLLHHQETEFYRQVAPMLERCLQRIFSSLENDLITVTKPEKIRPF